MYIVKAKSPDRLFEGRFPSALGVLSAFEASPDSKLLRNLNFRNVILILRCCET